METNYSASRKILGTTVCRTGVRKHINGAKRKTQEALGYIRYKSLSTKIKFRLVKVFRIPIPTYPPTPVVDSSESGTLQLQKMQNRLFRFAYDEILIHVTQNLYMKYPSSTQLTVTSTKELKIHLQK